MTKNRKDTVITIILLIIFSGLVFLNFLSYEIFEKGRLARIERHNALEARQQEKLEARQAVAEYIRAREMARDQDIRDIYDFDEKYSALKRQYRESIAEISEELEEKVVNISDIGMLANRRISAAVQFKESLAGIGDIPQPLEDFYDLLVLFLENDISTWTATRSYYTGEYDGDISGIERLHAENALLYDQVRKMQEDIYSRYGLEDLL